MKKIIIPLLFLFSICSNFVSAQKYAYIDSKYILDNIPEYKDAQTQLDELSSKWQTEIEEKHVSIEKLYKKYQADEILLPEEIKKKRQDEIIEKEREAKDLQKKRFGVDGDLFKKRQELIEPIQNKIYKAIKQMATDGSYAFVFDKANQSNIMYADPKFDKSKTVLKKLGYKTTTN